MPFPALTISGEAAENKVISTTVHKVDRLIELESGDENMARMKRGSAPIGWDGYSVESHHPNGIKNDFNNFVEVSIADRQEVWALISTDQKTLAVKVTAV